MEIGRRPLTPLPAQLRKLAISPLLPASTAWFAIPLRLIVGFGFIQHGYAKLARGPDDFINILHAIGVPVAFLAGWATIIVEIVGGVLIFIVPLATIPMSIVLLVAIFTVHLPNGFSSIKLQSFDAAGAHLDSPGTRRTFSIRRDLSPFVWGAPVHFQSTGF
jgi:putative oxidoreductase